MALIAGLLGACFALGLVTFLVAMRPVAPEERPPRKHRPALTLPRLTLRVVLGLVAAAVAGAVTHWPMAVLLFGIGGFMAPSMVGGGAARKVQLARIESMAAWAEMLRDTMAGSGGLEQSILATAVVAPQPIRPEVTRLAARLERERLAPSLRQFADEINDPAGDLVVAALILAADKSPKRLGDLLGRLATSARADVSMRLRVEAGRARTRTSVRVISAFTTGFAVFLLLTNRDYLDPYDTAVGQLVLGMIGLCFGGAYFWLSRAFRQEDEERLLRTEGLEL
jgi:Flp pilus assembly protein TadB